MKKIDWKITEAKDHWLEIEDPEGWYSAAVKWDGCVHYYRYYNQPKNEEGRSDKDVDYIHICDLQGEIDRLYSLLQVVREHYKNHHYYHDAWKKEPEIASHSHG